jgi:hypothetical protein
MLRSLAVQLSVPGDAYFVGRQVTQAEVDSGVLLDAEPDENGRVWTVQPVNTMRPGRRGWLKRRGWDIQVNDGVWVPLPEESLVCRIWDRNEHLPWRAMSPAKAALTIMREIDMYNRHIMATLISRVALNGFFFIPDEVTLPVNPNYEQEQDPFMSELLDIMTRSIKNPGSPAAAMPLPLRVPAEYIEKFKHLQFATPMDEKIFDARNQAIRRLASTLNLPAEIVLGVGGTNHWSAWQLTEDAIKIHISPKVEIITRCLTLGYLHPMLRAQGDDVRTADGSRIVMWYDTSELTQRPDRSGAAIQLRQVHAISDEALRRETGFDEADAPTDDELERQILTDLSVNPQTAAPALKELTGLELGAGPQAGTAVAPNPQEVRAANEERAMPGTQGVPPPAPGSPQEMTASARLARARRRVRSASREFSQHAPVRTRVGR